MATGSGLQVRQDEVPPTIHIQVLWPAFGTQKEPEKEVYTLTDYDMADFTCNFVKMLGGEVLNIHQHL